MISTAITAHSLVGAAIAAYLPEAHRALGPAKTTIGEPVRPCALHRYSAPHGSTTWRSPLEPRQILLHELATNAAKHGVLSTQNGRVSIRWRRVHNDSRSSLVLDWREVG